MSDKYSKPHENPKGKTFSLWICDKCKKEYPRNELTELFGWAAYICTPCINDFLPDL